MAKNRELINRIISVFCAAVLLFLTAPVFTAETFAAENAGTKKVRVAADDSGLFYVLNKEGMPVSGYAYEYIEKIAAYSNWDVEYVPVSDFAECYRMLIDGGLDLLYDVSYSPERAEQILFPDMPMGTEEYYLFCNPETDKINAMDYASYDGRKVGTTSGTIQVDYLKAWAQKKGISLDIINFHSIPEKEEALAMGAIDLDLEISMLANKNFTALDKISGDDYYLVVNRDRSDLLNDINNACAKINSIDRNYLNNLEEKYFARSLVSKLLTADEAEWVAGHDTLTIGYMNDYLPFSTQEKSGEVSGIVKDMVPLMIDNIGLTDQLKLDYVAYEDNEEMYRALLDGSVDCIFPVCGNMNFALMKNVMFSSDIIGVGIDLAYIDTYSEQTLSKIAVNANNQLQDFSTRYFYPNSEIVYYDTIEECLDAVVAGKVGATVLNGMRTLELLQRGRYSEVLTRRLPENAELSFAVKEGNSALLAILDRAIANTDDGAAAAFSYDYHINTAATVSQIEFFRTHPEYVLGAIAFLCILAHLSLVHRKKHDRKHAEKVRREQIAKMTGEVSLYIVNPLTGRFAIISQNEHLSANYTSQEDFATAFTKYIENDVYEKDRELVRESIDIPAIVANLETEDEYIFRYRDISNGSPHWYEMRAVKLSDSEILCGFTDKDNEISEQLLFDRMRENYIGLYYVNLDADLAKVLISQIPDVGGLEGTTVPYGALVKAVADKTDGEEAELLNRISDVNYMKQYFAGKEHGYTIYKSHAIAKDNWINLTGFVLSRNNDGTPLTMGMGFSLLDEDASDKEDAKRRLAESMEVVGGLAEEYTALYYVNLDTGDYAPYQLSGRSEGVKEYYEACPKFLDLAERFANSDMVRPEDRETLHNLFPSYEEVRKALTDRKMVSTLFKRNYDGEFLWTEMSVVKCEGINEEAHNVIVGFIEKNQEITEEAAHIKEAQETDQLIENIASQYSFAYVVNMSDDSFRVLRADHAITRQEAGRPVTFQNAVEKFINGPLHPVERDRMLRELDYSVIRSKLAERKSYNVEYRVLIDDQTMWHQMNVTAIDEDNIAVGFGGKDLEITKRHLSNKRYDELFALFEVDLDTERLRVVKNEQHYREVPEGKSVPYVTFIKNFAETLDEEPKVFFMQISDLDYVRQDLASDDKRTYTYKSTHISGDDWIEVTTYVIARHEDGTPAMITLGFCFVDALATARQEIQAQLREAYNQVKEANLRNDLLINIAHAARWSFNISPDDKIVGVDFDHNVTNQMEFVETMEPMDWLKAVHPEDRVKVMAECDAAMHDHDGKARYEVTFRMLDLEGGYRWLRNSGRVICHEDGTRELFGMSINITKQIEKEREQQKQLEEARNAAEIASKSKTSFLFNMSHDIRTPMNAIIGFTNMAKKHIDDKSKVRNYLNKIDLSGNQLLTLINQVLEMARIDSGKIELSETPVDLRVEFYALTTVLAEQAKINGLRFSTALECIEHEHVFADTARMSSITLNITGNAMKYTPKGGRIDFSLKEIPSRKDGYATYVFTVQDTGIGMSEEYLKVLYDPFTREKSSTVSRIQGTGLGMAIVKNLVDLMGGNIEVQTEEGKGTRFDITIDLRIDNEERSRNDTDVLEDVSFEGKRILLVEDNELNREIATAILEEEGIIIEDANDGSVAVRILEEKGPDYYDYVLMDIQMPIMNGYEATKAIRQMYPNSRLPIISLSANAFSEDKERALAAGMNDHVAKPINTKELFSVLAKY